MSTIRVTWLTGLVFLQLGDGFDLLEGDTKEQAVLVLPKGKTILFQFQTEHDLQLFRQVLMSSSVMTVIVDLDIDNITQEFHVRLDEQ